MRIAVATCLAGALLIACTVEAPSPRENDSDGKPGAAPPNVENKAIAPEDGGAEPSSSAEAGVDSSADADASIWAGAGDACNADLDCAPAPRWCLQGYCAPLCWSTSDNECAARGGTCVHHAETPVGIAATVCQKLR